MSPGEYSALFLDDSHAVGNTIDAYNKYAMHVIVGNWANQPIPVYPNFPGVENNFTYQGATTPGTEQTLITQVVPAGKSFYLLQTLASCNQQGKFSVFIDGVLIGSGRTQPGHPDSNFQWSPFKIATAGQTVVVKFMAMTGRPATDIEVYVHARLV